jgi:hypothetical protein
MRSCGTPATCSELRNTFTILITCASLTWDSSQYNKSPPLDDLALLALPYQMLFIFIIVGNVRGTGGGIPKTLSTMSEATASMNS